MSTLFVILSLLCLSAHLATFVKDQDPQELFTEKPARSHEKSKRSDELFVYTTLQRSQHQEVSMDSSYKDMSRQHLAMTQDRRELSKSDKGKLQSPKPKSNIESENDIPITATSKGKTSSSNVVKLPQELAQSKKVDISKEINQAKEITEENKNEGISNKPLNSYVFDISFNISNHVPIRDTVTTVFWLHIQKTSSWLGNFLMVWACPQFCMYDLHHRNIYSNNILVRNNLTSDDLNYYKIFDREYFQPNDISGNNMLLRSAIMKCSVNFESHGFNFALGVHVPYHDPSMNHTIITLFRKPSSRFISAFLFNKMLPTGSKPFPNHSYEETKRIIHQAPVPILKYAEVPGIMSCQTKMIIGHHCGEVMTLNDSHIQEAIRRVSEDLYFFGLTEETEATANLFLAMHYEDGSLPHRKRLEDLVHPPFNFTNTRKNPEHSEEYHKSLLNSLISSGWKDEFDEALFTFASKLFYKRCKLYKIKTKFESARELTSHMHV